MTDYCIFSNHQPVDCALAAESLQSLKLDPSNFAAFTTVSFTRSTESTAPRSIPELFLPLRQHQGSIPAIIPFLLGSHCGMETTETQSRSSLASVRACTVAWEFQPIKFARALSRGIACTRCPNNLLLNISGLVGI